MIMDNKAYITLVNPHAKRISRTDNFILVSHQLLFNILTCFIIPICMIILGRKSLLGKKRGNHFCIILCCSIYNTCSGTVWKDLGQIGKLFSSTAYLSYM